MTDEPQFDARTGEPVGLIPEGIYEGTIVSVGDIKTMISRSYTSYVSLKVEIEGQIVFANLSGYPDAIKFIKRHESKCIGEKLRVKIVHERIPYSLRTFMRAIIIWETP